MATLLGLLLVFVLSSYAQSDYFFDAQTFNDVNKGNFNLINCRIDEAQSNVELTLNPLSSSQIWYKTPVFLRGFNVSASFYIGKQADNGAQGIAFVIQNSGLTSSGGVGAGMGYSSPVVNPISGIKNSLAIEFDCQQNSDMNDLYPYHISVHTRATDDNSAHEDYSIAQYNLIPDFCMQKTTTVEIVYEPGTLKISLSTIPNPILVIDYNLENSLTLQANGKGFIGFTSSTGDNGGEQDLLKWRYEFLGRISPQNTRATGDGITKGVAGVENIFLIQAVDQYGNDFLFGNGDVKVTITGPTTVTPTVEDFENGLYQVSYTTTVSGEYDVSVSVNSVLIGDGNPVQVPISPAKGSGSNSKLTTEVPENFAANEEQILNLELYDEFNNRVVDGSDSVVATLSPSNPSDEIVITNNQDGSYIISIIIQVAKSYQLSITVNDQPISGGSFPMTVVPGPIDPNSCIIDTFPDTYDAGIPENFQIISYDAYGNKLTKGGSTFTITITPPSDSSDIKVTDLGTGSYSVNVYLQKSGSFVMSIRIGTQSVADSPYSIGVNPGILSIPHCEATGDGLTMAFAGVQAEFEIITKDEYGNLLTGLVTTQFQVELRGPTTITGTTKNNLDGTVTATFISTKSGSYQNYITASTINIENSPATTNIDPAKESAAHSTVIDPEYSFQDSEVLKASWLQIQVIDEYNNNIQIGGHNVKGVLEFDESTNAKATKEPIYPPTVNVTDNQNGTYTLAFVATEKQKGDYKLSITLEGNHIKDSPFTVVISPLDKKNTVLLAVGLTVIIACIIILIGVLAYKRWKKKSDYRLIENDRKT